RPLPTAACLDYLRSGQHLAEVGALLDAAMAITSECRQYARQQGAGGKQLTERPDHRSGVDQGGDAGSRVITDVGPDLRHSARHLLASDGHGDRSVVIA